jgi:hypothetical protein
VEANRILRGLMESIGVAEALAIWVALTSLLGLGLAVFVPWALRLGVERGMLTRLDRAVLEAYGVEGGSKLILGLALALGAVGPLLNTICLIVHGALG